MSCVVELLRSWSHPRAIVLTAIAIGTAGCSAESVRFNDPFSTQSAPGEVTGSVPAARTAPVGRVETSSLPPPAAQTAAVPSRPATTAATSGVAGGGRGLATYQPGTAGSPETTGTVQTPPAPARAPGNNTQWSWNGGTAVTVARGETVDSIARHHGVPSSVIMQANNLGAGQAIYPGQRLVIPRYNQAAAPALRPTVAAAKPAPQTAPANGLGVHIVAPGETLSKISRIYKKPLVELAKVNNIQPQATLHIGDKIIIPGMRTSDAQQKGASKVAEAKPLGNPAPAAKAPAAPAIPVSTAKATPPAKPVKQPVVSSSEPTQTAAMVTPATETPAATTGSAKTAEGAPPSFRWPVKARVIAGFGPRPNGQQNDGINLAVPEGTAVKAAEDGVVAYAGSELKGYGNLVLVRHSNGYVTAYAHAKELMVKRGDPIKRGQVIAKSGQTGNVDAPQLHFEIRKGPAPMDPMPMLSGG
jgi:murein DD-endopeptidase MepM/ murein hydrolase activator NlpD